MLLKSVNQKTQAKSGRFTILALMVWAVCPLFGRIVLTPKNVGGLYRAGESVVWTVKTEPQSSTTIATYTALKNGIRSPFKQGTLDLSSGYATDLSWTFRYHISADGCDYIVQFNYWTEGNSSTAFGPRRPRPGTARFTA